MNDLALSFLISLAASFTHFAITALARYFFRKRAAESRAHTFSFAALWNLLAVAVLLLVLYWSLAYWVQPYLSIWIIVGMFIIVSLAVTYVVERAQRLRVRIAITLLLAGLLISVVVHLYRTQARFVALDCPSSPVERQEVVTGRVISEDWKVLLLVKPQGSDGYYVQRRPVIGGDGAFRGEVVFGEEADFEVIAIAGPSLPAFRNGQVVADSDFTGAHRSALCRVTTEAARARPR